MAMGKCRECGKDTSSEAKVCPHCGIKAPIKKQIGIVGIIGALAVGAFIFKCSTDVHDSNTRRDAIEAAKTPEQRTAEAAENARREVAFQRTVAVVKRLKQNLREPDSVVWEQIYANDDATTICITYRARNGFGGMNRESVVIANGKASQEPAAWNRHCANKALRDMKKVTYAL